MCGGIGILDYDGDGLMDIFFSNGAKLPELEKDRSVVLQLPAAQQRERHVRGCDRQRPGLSGQQLDFSYGVAVGDYDNDGRPDIFIANTGKNTLYHNNGNGTFTDVTDTSGWVESRRTLSVQAAWFDYDNDGLLDLVVSNYTLWTPEKDRRCQRGDVDVYCSPRTYRQRSATALPQSGQRQVRRRDANSPDLEQCPAREWASASPTSTMTAGWMSSLPMTPNGTFFS